MILEPIIIRRVIWRQEWQSQSPRSYPKINFKIMLARESATGHFWLNVYYLVPVPPSPLVYWNHWVSGIFWLRSLKNKDLYQSILE